MTEHTQPSAPEAAQQPMLLEQPPDGLGGAALLTEVTVDTEGVEADQPERVLTYDERITKDYAALREEGIRRVPSNQFTMIAR